MIAASSLHLNPTLTMAKMQSFSWTLAHTPKWIDGEGDSDSHWLWRMGSA
jgi:hypothetical protein